jgi:hypothetical protein
MEHNLKKKKKGKENAKLYSLGACAYLFCDCMCAIVSWLTPQFADLRDATAVFPGEVCLDHSQIEYIMAGVICL